MTFGVIDGIFALVIFLGLIVGVVKGFYDLITRPIRFFAAICITFLLAGPIIDAWLGPYFSQLLSGTITQALIEKSPGLAADSVDAMPFFFKALAFVFGVDTSGVVQNLEEGQSVAEALGGAIGAPLGNFVGMIVAYLAIFVISLLVLKIVMGLLGKVITAGPMHAIDKTLGSVFGVAVACLLCCIAATVINAASKDFQGGFLYDFLLSLNPFVTQK